MSLNGILQLAVYFLLLLAITKPIGVYMTRVFSGEKTFLSRVLEPIERLIYRLCRVDATEQHWTTYTAAMLIFSVVSLLVLYALQRLQYFLPLNPQQFTGVAPD